jgi:hypothetical protein
MFSKLSPLQFCKTSTQRYTRFRIDSFAIRREPRGAPEPPSEANLDRGLSTRLRDASTRDETQNRLRGLTCMPPSRGETGCGCPAGAVSRQTSSGWRSRCLGSLTRVTPVVQNRRATSPALGGMPSAQPAERATRQKCRSAGTRRDGSLHEAETKKIASHIRLSDFLNNCWEVRERFPAVEVLLNGSVHSIKPRRTKVSSIDPSERA